MRICKILLCTCLVLSVFVFSPSVIQVNGEKEFDLVINEIMYNPAGPEIEGEWVEIYNNGTISVDMGNWSLADQESPNDPSDIDFVFPEDFVISQGGYVVVHVGSGINESDFSDNVAHLFMGKTSAIWDNTGDDILLKNETGYGVDYVAYDYGSYVDLCPPELNWDDENAWVYDEGNSISLHPSGCDKDSGLCWEESDPTPGKPNAHLCDLPPEISWVIHNPLNPRTSEDVTITSNVTDEHCLKSVFLYYSINGSGHLSVPMSFDGANFTYQLPSQPEGTIIKYYICASDDAEQFSISDNYSYAYTDLPYQVMINEFLPDPETDWNSDGYVDSDDEWIELFNSGETIVNLGGWTVDDELGSVGSSDPYTIDHGVFIEPEKYLVFYGNETEILLNNNEDNVSLLDEKGNVVDIFSYESTTNDTALGRFPDGSENLENFLLPTPGIDNIYTVESMENLTNIKINEFLPAPKSAFSSEWIELYNSGTTSVRLDGLLLDDVVDSGKKPFRIPLETVLLPGEYYIHSENRGLNNDGDTVNLLYIDGTVLDSYSYESCEYDVSYGRRFDGDSNWASFSNPTFGQSNTPYKEPNSGERQVIISELFYKAQDDYEFLSLYNPTDSEIDLSGWRICDGQTSYSGTVIFPEGSQIPSEDRIFIAHNASLFYEICGFLPDFEMENSTFLVPNMMARNMPSFSNERDEVLLLDGFGNLIDIVVYGDSDYEGQGWMGSPISDAKKGEVLKRNFNESSHKYSDTNSSLDWKHMRHFKLGQSDFKYTTFTYSGNITLFSSPDSSFDTIIEELDKAESSIYMGLYQFTNWNIAEKIIEKLNKGVEVKILMEGGPVEGIIEEQKYVLQKINEKKGEIKYLVSDLTLSERYRYIHAKYAIIDNTSVVISSENWKYTGIPVNKTYGNRGWGVIIRNREVAEYYKEVFFCDWNSVNYDTILFTPTDSNYGNASSDFEPDDWVETGYYNPVFQSITIPGDFKVYPVLSPDTSILESEAILGMINSATESIYIEQLELDINWNDGELEYENLYLKAAIEAAEKRGVDVKILLSSAYAFPDDPDLDNYDTFIFINVYALNHNITGFLEARLVDYDRLGLAKMHNKGMIVDGNKTLISSINWNRNSVAQNREVGVIIESKEVADYFTSIFFWDWNEPPLAYAGKDITVHAFEFIQFNDFSFDSDYNIKSYFWDFDDYKNSTEKNPNHVFEKEGVYEVKLTVSDGQYLDSCTICVIVLEPESEGGESAITISMILLIILITIFLMIIAAIRRMRLRFI